MVRRGARSKRTDARTPVRRSACPPGAGGRPGAGPWPCGQERRGGGTGRRGARSQSRYPLKLLRGRARASQPASGEGEGRPRARAPCPAPPAPPAGLRAGGGRRRGRCRWPPCRAPCDGPLARRGAGRGRLALTSPASRAAGGRQRCAQARPAETPAWGSRRGRGGGGMRRRPPAPPGPERRQRPRSGRAEQRRPLRRRAPQPGPPLPDHVLSPQAPGACVRHSVPWPRHVRVDKRGTSLRGRIPLALLGPLPGSQPA